MDDHITGQSQSPQVILSSNLGTQMGSKQVISLSLSLSLEDVKPKIRC